jgi:uncharacterized protein
MSRWDDLLAVQGHDTTIDQLEHRRRTLPQRAELDAATAELVAVEADLARVGAQRHELERAQQAVEDEVAGLTEKMGRSEATLYGGTVTNPRELQSLQEELDALRRRISHLEDTELEHMVAAEPLDAELAALEERRAGLDARMAGLRAAITEAEVSIDADLEQVRGERDTIAKGADPVLLAEYEALRARMGGIAIARLEGGSCLGCHLKLSAVEVDRIKHLPPDEPVHCEECGRLLAR